MAAVLLGTGGAGGGSPQIDPSNRFKRRESTPEEARLCLFAQYYWNSGKGKSTPEDLTAFRELFRGEGDINCNKVRKLQRPADIEIVLTTPDESICISARRDPTLFKVIVDRPGSKRKICRRSYFDAITNRATIEHWAFKLTGEERETCVEEYKASRREAKIDAVESGINLALMIIECRDTKQPLTEEDLEEFLALFPPIRDKKYSTEGFSKLPVEYFSTIALERTVRYPKDAYWIFLLDPSIEDSDHYYSSMIKRTITLSLYDPHLHRFLEKQRKARRDYGKLFAPLAIATPDQLKGAQRVLNRQIATSPDGSVTLAQLGIHDEDFAGASTSTTRYTEAYIAPSSGKEYYPVVLKPLETPPTAVDSTWLENPTLHVSARKINEWIKYGCLSAEARDKKRKEEDIGKVTEEAERDRISKEIEGERKAKAVESAERERKAKEKAERERAKEVERERTREADRQRIAKENAEREAICLSSSGSSLVKANVPGESSTSITLAARSLTIDKQIQAIQEAWNQQIDRSPEKAVTLAELNLEEPSPFAALYTKVWIGPAEGSKYPIYFKPRGIPDGDASWLRVADVEVSAETIEELYKLIFS